MGETIACHDLLHSVYLAPNQVRTCCKRFFVDGEQKGDVVLLDTHLTQPSAHSILKAKQVLHQKINQGEETSCSGCPYLEKKDWGGVDKLDIHHLSFEYHSVCNMKCDYCSDIYYGGLQANYDVTRLIDEFSRLQSLINCESVVWGGGEPTINKDFIPLIEKISNELDPEQRIFTNALQFKKEILDLIESGNIHITTSVDAGTETTFEKVRGYPGKSGLKKVLKNLQRYSRKEPEKITIKYILTEDNCSMDEINKFISHVEKYKLLLCNFQISINYKYEAVEDELLFSALVLYGLLKKNNTQRVFLDDLLWERMSSNYLENKSTVDEKLQQYGYADLLENPSQHSQVIVWGAGQIANNVVNKSVFFKGVDVKFFVDSNKDRLGDVFNQKEIKQPEAVTQVDYPVYIASTQHFPAIIAQLKELGVSQDRIISSVVI